MRIHPTALVLGAAALTLLGSNAAMAQELEEIVVTSTKRAENLQDVPITVTALKADELTSTGVDTSRALAMVSTNIAVNVNASFIAPYIRGVGTQYANPGLEPSVATYFNDLYISRPSAGFIQFSDIDRVEVLKGPQGTLYGRNTTGGAIRIITKDPTKEFEAHAGVGFGRYNDRIVDGVVSGTISGNLMGRLAAQFQKRDGWVKNIAGGPDMENRDIYMLHGKLLWQPNENLKVKFSGDYTNKDDREGVAFQSLFNGAPQQTAAAFGGLISRYGQYSGDVHKDEGNDLTQHADFRGAELRVDYELGWGTFSSITGYRYTRFQGVADLDGTNVPFFSGQTNEDKTEDYSQEFQLVSKGNEKVNWIAGLFYLKEKAHDDFGFTGIPFIDAMTGFQSWVGGDGTIDVKSLAAYGQLTYKFTDQWEAELGLRYTDEKKDVTNKFYVTGQNGRTAPTFPRLVVVPVPNDSFKFSKATPKLQFNWRPREDLMLFASFSQGLKSGGFNMPSPSASPVTKVNNEELRAAEIGWKTEFNRVRFNGALFHYDIKDLQVQVTDLAGGITTVRNAGDAKVDGIEVDLTIAATDQLQFDVGAGWQDAKFESVPGGNFNPPCAAAPTDPQCVSLGGLGLATVIGNLKGNKLPQAPAFTAYARASYSHPLENGSTLGWTLSGNFADKFSYTPDNLYNEDPHFLANATIDWKSADGRFTIGAYVNNLTDEEYYTHNATLALTGGWRVPGPPRWYGMRFGVNFQ